MTPEYKAEFFRDRRNQWRWRLRHRNGRITADSAEGYKRRVDCVRQFERIEHALAGGRVERVFL